MGILNTTPDSFSDGGQFQDHQQAINHAMQMLAQGASIIDVGGESTRPGASPVSPQLQIKRTQPIIQSIAQYIDNHYPRNTDDPCLKPIISIDTTSSQVAAAAIQAGAKCINDVSAATDDPQILALAAKHQIPICLMHKQGSSQAMQQNPTYQNVLKEVLSFLKQQAQKAYHAGIPKNHIILDPGIGFGKTPTHNLILLNHLDQLADLGYPTLLGTSRKSILKHFFQNQNIPNPTTQQLDQATAITTALGLNQNVKIFRVHHIQLNKIALALAQQIRCAADEARSSCS